MENWIHIEWLTIICTMKLNKKNTHTYKHSKLGGRQTNKRVRQPRCTNMPRVCAQLDVIYRAKKTPLSVMQSTYLTLTIFSRNAMRCDDKSLWVLSIVLAFFIHINPNRWTLKSLTDQKPRICSIDTIQFDSFYVSHFLMFFSHQPREKKSNNERIHAAHKFETTFIIVYLLRSTPTIENQ